MDKFLDYNEKRICASFIYKKNIEVPPNGITQNLLKTSFASVKNMGKAFHMFHKKILWHTNSLLVLWSTISDYIIYIFFNIMYFLSKIKKYAIFCQNVKTKHAEAHFVEKLWDVTLPQAAFETYD